MVSTELMPQEMTTPIFKAFLRKWRDALRELNPLSELDWWEGKQACAELKSTGYLRRVRLEEKSEPGSARGSALEHFIPSHDVPHICTELRIYREYLGQIRQRVERDKDRKDWLVRQSVAFKKKADLWSRDSELREDLKRIRKNIELAKRGVKYRFEEEWTRSVGIAAPPYRGHKTIVQARELDSWFQVRLAHIFRADLPKGRHKDERGPSLRTIARLLVLFLVCAELADEKEGEVKLRHNQRKITVAGVLQQLRGAGFDSNK
jgi:hypothetical protein